MKLKPPLFELRNISLSFSGKAVLKDLSLKIEKGEKLILRGPSGCGKSTVLKLLLGLVQADSGEIFVNDRAMSPEVAWKIRSQTAYAGQKIDTAPESVSEFALSSFDFKNNKAVSKPDPKTILDAMSEFDLSPDLLGKNTEELSGGELQRIVLVSITLPGRSIYILDEPTAALDKERKEKVIDFFLNKNSTNTVIVASHDEEWNRPNVATIRTLNSQNLKTEH